MSDHYQHHHQHIYEQHHHHRQFITLCSLYNGEPNSEEESQPKESMIVEEACPHRPLEQCVNPLLQFRIPHLLGICCFFCDQCQFSVSFAHFSPYRFVPLSFHFGQSSSSSTSSRIYFDHCRSQCTLSSKNII